MIELIAQRVVTALRDDLEAIAAGLSSSTQLSEHLTVGQVAQRLGVARSTVYAHWREWGGYKLGRSDKAPIRFPSAELPVVNTEPTSLPTPLLHPKSTRAVKKRRRRDLLADAPRLAPNLDGVA